MVQLLATLQETTGKAARNFFSPHDERPKNVVRVKGRILTKVHHEHDGCEDVDSELETEKLWRKGLMGTPSTTT